MREEGAREAPALVLDEAPASGGAPLGRLIRGDALDVARALANEGLEGKADLVYVDPPYASQTSYHHEARLDGAADGRVARTVAYDDRWGDDEGGVGSYLDMLAPRLEAAARLLAPTGTLWVHLDYRSAYLVRVVLEEILGRGSFLNEIVWRRAPNLGRQAASGQFGRTLDTILVYGGKSAELALPTRPERIEDGAVRVDENGRAFTCAPRGDYTDKSIARLEAEGRVHRTPSGKVYIKYFLTKDAGGGYCRERRVDALWTDIAPLRHASPAERTGYPTQKPLALLDRIVRCAAPPGGLVVDLFSGSGTTGEAAFRAGRRFVLGDAGPVAIAVARARLLRAGAPFTMERTGAARAPLGPPAELRVTPLDGGQLSVELVAPREPMGWAIDPSFREPAPFRAAWHAERRPGKRTVAAERVATVARGEGRLGVRVYGDDGSVTTAVAAAAAAAGAGAGEAP